MFSTAMPCDFAAGISAANPAAIAGWANPDAASTVIAPGLGRVTTGVASPITLPSKSNPSVFAIYGKADEQYLYETNRAFGLLLEAAGQRQITLELPDRAARTMLDDEQGLQDLAALIAGFAGPWHSR